MDQLGYAEGYDFESVLRFIIFIFRSAELLYSGFPVVGVTAIIVITVDVINFFHLLFNNL